MKLNIANLTSSPYFYFDEEDDMWFTTGNDELKVLGYEDGVVYAIIDRDDEMTIVYLDETEDSYPVDTDIQFNIYTLKEVI